MTYTVQTDHIDLFIRGERIAESDGEWYPFEVYLWRYETTDDWDRAVQDLMRRKARADQRGVAITVRVVLATFPVTGHPEVQTLAERHWMGEETLDGLREAFHKAGLDG